MTNLLAQAINCNDGDRAAKIIQDALGIESDDVVNYCFPKTWPVSSVLNVIGSCFLSASVTMSARLLTIRAFSTT
jgi:hypothetical protein